jgi:cysteine synthase A
MDEGILTTIGHTPLIELRRMFKGLRFRLFAKMESFNPGGSIKDRAALWILRDAMERGTLKPGATVIESSSGNMGIGLAQACAYLGLRFICVIDPKTTKQNIKILEAYGAEIDYVSSPDPLTGEFLPARINRVHALLGETLNSFWPDQYSNLANAMAHHQTMHEIVTELDGPLDYLFCATSTCGTMRGCAEYAREHHLSTRIVAVDAVGSAIFGNKPAQRLIPGHGAAMRPPLYQEHLFDISVHVTDLDCVIGCRQLMKQEALLVGGSSGAVLAAVRQLGQSIPDGATCVVILPDRGERYLDTIYSEAWVRKHFGETSYQWENQVEKVCV